MAPRRFGHSNLGGRDRGGCRGHRSRFLRSRAGNADELFGNFKLLVFRAETLRFQSGEGHLGAIGHPFVRDRKSFRRPADAGKRLFDRAFQITAKSAAYGIFNARPATWVAFLSSLPMN